jgi:hypothetical protein
MDPFSPPRNVSPYFCSSWFHWYKCLHPLIHELAVERRSVPRHIRNARIGFHLHKAASGSLHLSEARNVSNWGVFFTTDSPVILGARIDLRIDMPTEFNRSAQWLCWGRVVRVEAQDASDTILGIAVKYDCYEVVGPAARSPAAANFPDTAKSVVILSVPGEGTRRTST